MSQNLSTESKGLAASEEPVINLRKKALARICVHHRFLMVVCAISICDALIVASELTIDVLATKQEVSEVCDTRDILEYLEREYEAELRGFIESHTIDELLRKIGHRNDKGHFHVLIGSMMPAHHLTYSTYDNTTRVIHNATQVYPASTIRDMVFNKSISSPKKDPDYIMLYHVAHSLRYGSIALLSLMFLVNIVRVYALRSEFLHSRLQVVDAFVVIISLILDIIFLKEIWVFTEPALTAIPIIVGLSWRVIRVVNNALINLSEMDKIRLARVHALLKRSNKKARSRKLVILNLHALCRKLGAPEDDIRACSKSLKILKKKRSNSLIEGIMSINSLAFFGAISHAKLPHEKSLDDTELRNENEMEGQEIKYKRRYRRSTTDSSFKFRKMSSIPSFSNVSTDSYLYGPELDDDDDYDENMEDADDKDYDDFDYIDDSNEYESRFDEIERKMSRDEEAVVMTKDCCVFTIASQVEAVTHKKQGSIADGPCGSRSAIDEDEQAIVISLDDIQTDQQVYQLKTGERNEDAEFDLRTKEGQQAGRCEISFCNEIDITDITENGQKHPDLTNHGLVDEKLDNQEKLNEIVAALSPKQLTRNPESQQSMIADEDRGGKATDSSQSILPTNSKQELVVNNDLHPNTAQKEITCMENYPLVKTNGQQEAESSTQEAPQDNKMEAMDIANGQNQTKPEEPEIAVNCQTDEVNESTMRQETAIECKAQNTFTAASLQKMNQESKEQENVDE